MCFLFFFFLLSTLLTNLYNISKLIMCDEHATFIYNHNTKIYFCLGWVVVLNFFFWLFKKFIILKKRIHFDLKLQLLVAFPHEDTKLWIKLNFLFEIKISKFATHQQSWPPMLMRCELLLRNLTFVIEDEWPNLVTMGAYFKIRFQFRKHSAP